MNRLKVMRNARMMIFMLLTAFASSNAYGATITANGAIKQLHFWQGVTGVLIIHEHQVNPDNCTRNDQLILKQDHPFFKELYSLLLSAHIAGQPLRLGLQGCHEGFPVIVHGYSNK